MKPKGLANVLFVLAFLSISVTLCLAILSGPLAPGESVDIWTQSYASFFAGGYFAFAFAGIIVRTFLDQTSEDTKKEGTKP